MLHTVTAAEPMPSILPTTSASWPVSTTMKTLSTRHTPVTRVTPSRIGRVFQIGRPSGTS